MVERHGLDDSEGTGCVCWVKADLRVPSEAIAGAEKVRAARVLRRPVARVLMYSVCTLRAALNPDESSILRCSRCISARFYACFSQAVAWAGGSLDILVNNAGICVLEDFMDISSESFDESIAINTRAPLLVSQVSCTNYGRQGRRAELVASASVISRNV